MPNADICRSKYLETFAQNEWFLGSRRLLTDEGCATLAACSKTSCWQQQPLGLLGASFCWVHQELLQRAAAGSLMGFECLR